MIGISTPTYSPNGSILLKDIETDSDVPPRERRITRTATLDGEAEIEDMGMSHADRTFVIRARGLTRAEYDLLALGVEGFPLLIITTAEGAFMGAPEHLSINDGITTLRILIKEKIS